MNSRLSVKKLRVASLRMHDSQPLQTLFALVRKSSLPIVYTGFVQRGLPRSSPKNAAAPLYQQWILTSRIINESRMILRENRPHNSRAVPRERPVTVNMLATDRRPAFWTSQQYRPICTYLSSLHTATSRHPFTPPARAARLRRPPAPPARAAYSRRPLAPPACVRHAVLLVLRRLGGDARDVSTGQ